METHFYWLHFQTEGDWSDAAEQPALLPTAQGHDYLRKEPFVFALARCSSVRAPETLQARFRALLAVQQDTAAAAKWRLQTAFHELLLQLQEEAGSAAAGPQRAVADRAAAYLRRRFREPVSNDALAEALLFTRITSPCA